MTKKGCTLIYGSCLKEKPALWSCLREVRGDKGFKNSKEEESHGDDCGEGLISHQDKPPAFTAEAINICHLHNNCHTQHSTASPFISMSAPSGDITTIFQMRKLRFWEEQSLVQGQDPGRA